MSGGITWIEGAAGWVLVLGSGLLGCDGSDWFWSMDKM